jgi:hypothetical protein
MARQEIPHKQGATFDKLVTRLDAQGDPVDLTGFTVTSGVHNEDETFTDELTATVEDAANGIVRITHPATETALWPETDYDNKLFWDVRYQNGALVVFSETVEIVVEDNIT